MMKSNENAWRLVDRTSSDAIQLNPSLESEVNGLRKEAGLMPVVVSTSSPPVMEGSAVMPELLREIVKVQADQCDRLRATTARPSL